MQESRFFSIGQLWQSLAIVIVVAGIIGAAVTFGLGGTGPGAQATASTTNTDSLPAAATDASTTASDPFSSVHVTGQSAIVVDLSNGQTLYSQNADAQLPLASLTKLLTMYEAQSILSPDSIVTISSTSLAQDGDYGFVLGEKFAYKDISKLTMVASSNDAAEAIAEAAEVQSGDTPAQFMSAAVRHANLSRTVAINSTGLDIDTSEAGAYGSARDIAKLAGEFLMAAPDISKATTKPSITILSSAGVPHTLSNTNPDVNFIPGLLLSKTGYTDLAGGNLAVVFDAGINHRIAVVVLGSTEKGRFTDVESLIHAARASFRQQGMQ